MPWPGHQVRSSRPGSAPAGAAWSDSAARRTCPGNRRCRPRSGMLPVVEDGSCRSSAAPCWPRPTSAGSSTRAGRIDIAGVGSALARAAPRRRWSGRTGPSGRRGRIVDRGGDRAPGRDRVRLVVGLGQHAGAESAIVAEQTGDPVVARRLGDLEADRGASARGWSRSVRSSPHRPSAGTPSQRSGRRRARAAPHVRDRADHRTDHREDQQRDPPPANRLGRRPAGVDRGPGQRVLGQRRPVLHRERGPGLVVGARHSAHPAKAAVSRTGSEAAIGEHRDGRSGRGDRRQIQVDDQQSWFGAERPHRLAGGTDCDAVTHPGRRAALTSAPEAAGSA